MLETARFTAFIPVRDIDVARAFYVSTLGLTVTDESPFALSVDANGTPLRLTPVPDFAPQPFTIAGWQVADMATAIDALIELGVKFNRFDGMDQNERAIWEAPGGGLVAWFSDPDGNTLSLSSPGA